MDKYLIEMKEVSDSIEEVNVPLPKNVVVWYTLKNLPNEYEVLKQMILGDKLSTCSELEMLLLSEEMAHSVWKSGEKKSEALFHLPWPKQQQASL